MYVIYAAIGEICRLCYVLCRPSFKSLRRISTHFPEVPIMALTATAPPGLALLLEGILQNPEILKGSVNRSNLIFAARKIRFGGQIPKSVSDGKTSADDNLASLFIFHMCRHILETSG